MYVYIYIYVHVCIYISISLSIYIDIERERYRYALRSWGGPASYNIQYLAQDKGGPSKGGFLNNRLLSYTDLYLCSGINGMWG